MDPIRRVFVCLGRFSLETLPLLPSNKKEEDSYRKKFRVVPGEAATAQALQRHLGEGDATISKKEITFSTTTRSPSWRCVLFSILYRHESHTENIFHGTSLVACN